MCCESCPEYEKCSIDGYLKENCCKACPDYFSCYGGENEEYEDYNKQEE